MAARKVAAILAERYQLTPRVDIEEFVRQFATVEPCTWPNNDVDGLTVRATSGDELPQIFYRHSQPPRRRRFTLAHELGHLMLGWHIGSAFCTIDAPGSGRTSDEREADTFAADLLIPQHWVTALLDTGIGMSDAIKRLEEADVSPHASMIALSNALPTGWAFELPDATQLRSGYMPQYSAAEIASAGAHGSAVLHGTTVRWWRLFGSRDYEPGVDANTANEALADSLTATKSSLTTAQVTGKVGGYLGYAKTSMIDDPADMFAYVLWRFERESNNALPAHDCFKRWLSYRVDTIAKKRAQG